MKTEGRAMTPEEKRFRARSLKFSETVIREKVDLEGLFVADANYELSGTDLREVLAYAYRCGIIRARTEDARPAKKGRKADSAQVCDECREKGPRSTCDCRK